MPMYRVFGIEDKLAWRVRASLRSPDFDHPAYLDVMTTPGLCRVCLQPFEIGAERSVLFTYDPFREREPYPLPGPVHIHELACDPYERPGIPPGLAQIPLTLTGYAAGAEVIAWERPAPADIDAAAARLFAHPAVAYVHLRDTTQGFFVCELARSEEH